MTALYLTGQLIYKSSAHHAVAVLKTFLKTQLKKVAPKNPLFSTMYHAVDL